MSSQGSDGVGIILFAARRMSNAVTAPFRGIYRAVTRDGVIGASMNQARDELKEALRGLPDAVHVQPVTMSQSDGGGVHGPAKRSKSPSEIAERWRSKAESKQPDIQPGRSPSDIARNPRRQAENQDQARGNERQANGRE